MRSEISLLKHENSALKAKMERSDSPAGASGGKSRVKEEGGTVKLRQRIAQLEMQLKQKVTTVVVLSATPSTKNVFVKDCENQIQQPHLPCPFHFLILQRT